MSVGTSKRTISAPAPLLKSYSEHKSEVTVHVCVSECVYGGHNCQFSKNVRTGMSFKESFKHFGEDQRAT